MSRKHPFHSLFKLSFTAWTMLFLLSQCGCNSFGNNRLVKELQIENEKLLGEFRAQRDRNERLETEMRQQQERLAESEKLLARMSQNASGGRLSSLAPNYSFTGPGIGSSGSNSSASDKLTAPPTTAEEKESLRWQPRYAPAR